MSESSVSSPTLMKLTEQEEKDLKDGWDYFARTAAEKKAATVDPASLTPDERKNVKAYTAGSYFYINQMLQRPGATIDNLKPVHDEDDRTIEIAKQVNALAHTKLTEGQKGHLFTVTRGLRSLPGVSLARLREVNNMRDQRGATDVIGRVFTGAGIESWTSDRNVSTQFVGQGDETEGVKLELERPSVGLYIGDSKELSHVGGEGELIRPTGMKYRIISVEGVMTSKMGAEKGTETWIPVVNVEEVFDE